MPSHRNPFPGMNPYLEQIWSDVHVAIIGFIRMDLSGELPDDLVARAEENVDVFVEGDPVRYRADVAVREEVEPWQESLPPVMNTDSGDLSSARVATPVLFEAEPETEHWIEIRDEGGTLITVIEVISPGNKFRRCEAYQRKQRDLLQSGVNLVEIDLLRDGGPIVDDLGAHKSKLAKDSDYFICASRRGYPHRREVYFCALREPLPVIRIPLRSTDPDAPLDVQSLIDRTYETGRYWKLNYQEEPRPPLSESDSVWLDERLKAAGLR